MLFNECQFVIHTTYNDKLGNFHTCTRKNLGGSKAWNLHLTVSRSDPATARQYLIFLLVVLRIAVQELKNAKDTTIVRAGNS